MAITKMKPVHTHLKYLVGYVTDSQKTQMPEYDDLISELHYIKDDSKTERSCYVSGVNCSPESAYESMVSALKKTDKPVIVLAHHGIQSFPPGEVSAETAHEIGVRLAEELWGDKFVVLVATHLNKAHYHNHFLLCSTSPFDGSRYHACTATYWDMRNANDRLCREYGLSVNQSKGSRGKSYAERIAEKEGKPTFSSLIRSDVDLAIEQSLVMPHFFAAMEALGYEIKHGKYLAVRAKGAERFRRLKTLGEDYTEAAILRRIMANRRQKAPYRENYTSAGTYRFRGTFKKHPRLSGFRALYFHYLYKMKILPQHKEQGKRAKPLLREDLVKLDAIIEQNKFLHLYKIDTVEQIEDHRQSTEQQLAILETARAQLRAKLRRKLPQAVLEQTRIELTDLSKQMRELRKELKLCDAIEERSAEMQKKLKIVQAIEQNERQKQKEQAARKRGYR